MLLAAADFSAPHIDYHAIAPEIVLAAGICAVIIADLFLPEQRKYITGQLTGLIMLGAVIPVVTLGMIGDDVRSLFDGRYVIDNFALVMKGLFLIAGYVVVLMSANTAEEGRYHQGEYYTLLLASTAGMVMMCSARDLVSLFIALEFLSIPSFMLAGWRKRDRKSNEAGMKYFLLAVFSSAVMLYGMSLIYGVAGTTKLVDIAGAITLKGDFAAAEVLGVVFVIIGFAFKVSAVPFHSWAPDVYEGSPTPITAYLSVSSKAAGFVALIVLLFIAFPDAGDAYRPFLWALTALTMTIGNLIALRQTNIVRMLAYSSIVQGGYVMMPLVVADRGDTREIIRSIVVYLIIYAATNLGAFAVVIAVARKTGTGNIADYGGMLSYAPGLTWVMTLFLASLAGIPPFGGWYAKFGVFRAVLEVGGGWGNSIVIIAAINTVIAAAYYVNVMKEMWLSPVPNGDTSEVKVPGALVGALAITGVATLALGILPGLTNGSITDLAGALLR